ncbi:MAG: ribose 5-phosphate isomerase [SAR86 cluster bacterium BACL1 MAG-120920-bin57]|jgi:ribose 5-phosphate isomerase A|uniref:Ribose-5-phosphate isomerase A n=2 Tax=SAR86 cluster TaxID=62672 RepID=A0A0R2U583_9GAMM|nr:MAG: ribose 5-phosphate isomerase [SAR86 cluster bacterium BACL1 MAG-120507-bin14]KRO38551.1 MAG: ribose 5-phosphate isomerase [SAR86 cluster bacterium BACL1 MAG-120920-bin57]KRO94152.1 MAG: ribose 5-phosphate isomerase [SAR86 cluster bacterium BACL1 MAG-120820-bin45]KRO96595.1 MAG: ribose 5-phosphate isomerase [SAR86 cluster bacterium BACL1 MAG-120828-bin5]KRO97989.1 MAG: ribose 5-phosphate isomerase [SAR86 cluster bacterium BACL1 MAG-120823-bin87]KRO99042.1 MAG: ribose 5-phosphate isomera
MNKSKLNASIEACEYLKATIDTQSIIGVGTGSTVNFFIAELGKIKNLFKGAVSSSEASSKLLMAQGIEIFELNDVNEVLLYVDGADEVDEQNYLIKGGGGAHTREKIVAAASQEFICIVDKSKLVKKLGTFPLPVEVLERSRSYVARELVKLGGTPILRQGFLTDHGNQILDVRDLQISNPMELEQKINLIPGVVDNGIFAHHKPSKIIVGSA